MRWFAILSTILLAACSPLTAFNALVPKDSGVARIGSGLRYADGRRGGIDLYAPRGAGLAKRPVILFLYGGSWSSGDKDGYAFAGRALAAEGFLVAIPDYRLVPAVRYPAFLEDNAAAFRWLRAHAARFGGDPDRIVIVGHSAGAYNAAMLALDPRWLGEDRRAVRGLVGLAGPYSFLPLDTAATKNAFGAVADLPATQVLRYASADDPPALLLAGAEDEIVRPRQAAELAAALTRAGGRAQSRIYPGIGHAGMVTALSVLLRSRAPVLADTAAFARRAAGLEAAFIRD